jgi:hypothetical protein
MENLAATNVWLAILAIVSLLEFLMIVTAGFLAYRLYSRVAATVETVERVHIAPVRARVDAVIDDVQAITARVKHAQESFGDKVRHAADTGGAVAEAVRAKTWPLVGIVQAIRAAASTVAANGRSDKPPVTH